MVRVEQDQVNANEERKIPNLATTEEVLAVVRQAVLEYGRNLESHRKRICQKNNLRKI